MQKYRAALSFRMMACLLVAASAFSSGGPAQPQASGTEQTVWNLEHVYWRHVQDNDLTAYLSLWHKDFLGWPASDAAPVRKDHITDWITRQTSKGLAFKTGELKPGGIQVTGDIAVVCYWITFRLVDKDGKGAAQTLRITHTWLKNGNDWRIIGGMSMPEPATPQK
jgi:ketosteroid isomerase-like protein